MLKKITVVLVVSVLAQLSQASDKPTTISKDCASKIEQFAGAFAVANQMNLGGGKVTIDKVTINSSAMTIGESSGFAKGTGSYDSTITFDGDEPESGSTEFVFTYATEPHCAIMSISVKGLQD